MRGLSKAIVVGNIGDKKEIQLKNPVEGSTALRLRVATNWIDRVGNRHTDWHTVLIFGPLADTAQKILNIGDRIYVEGRLRSREYEKDGVRHTTWEIWATDLLKLSPPPQKEEKEEEELESMEMGSDIPGEEVPENVAPNDLPF